MDKKNLISEELKRHMELLEYTFYMEDRVDGDPETEDLLLGAKKLYEQDPIPGEEEGGEVEDPFATDAPPAEEGGEGEVPAEGGETDPFADAGGMEIEDEFATDEVSAEGGDETVEVDVTDIVDKSEQTRAEIEGLTSKMDELLGKLGDLEGKVGDMDQVINKIDDLEKEIEERNPTPDGRQLLI